MKDPLTELEIQDIVNRANQGEIHAQLKLGNMYWSGRDVEKDISQAERWFIRASNTNDPKALCRLAEFYRSTKKQEGSFEIFECYAKAALQGDSWALFRLARIYERGKIVEQDLQMSFILYSKSAELGRPSAKCHLASFYEKGIVVEKSTDKAYQLYQEAAEGGNSDAQCKMGLYYVNGVYTQRNYNEAIRWFGMAEESNYVASYNLGLIYLEGPAYVRDINKAYHYLIENDIEIDNSHVVRLLADKYRKGEDVDMNIERANKLYALADEIDG